MRKVFDPDIRVVLEKLDKKINNLQLARDVLLQEYSASNSAPSTIESKPKDRTKKKSRKEEIVDFLLIHGPMKKAEIAEISGIPKGTLSFVFNDKKTFRLLDGSIWDVQESLKDKQPLEREMAQGHGWEAIEV